MLTLGVPHVVALERVHTDIQTTVVVHEDVSNEDALPLLEEEEIPVAPALEFVAVNATELVDLLARCEAEPIEVTQTPKELSERPVHDLFVDSEELGVKFDRLHLVQTAEVGRRCLSNPTRLAEHEFLQLRIPLASTNGGEFFGQIADNSEPLTRDCHDQPNEPTEHLFHVQSLSTRGRLYVAIAFNLQNYL